MISTSTYPEKTAHQAMARAENPRNQRVYQTLGEIKVDHDQINFYAVVMDASLPHKANNKWVSTLKLVDATHHSTGSAARETTFINCIFYGRRQEECPEIACIGDIIRVHRATAKQFKDNKQLYCNVTFNSSWLLFSATEENAPNDNGSDDATGGMRPYKFVGKNYSFNNEHERPILSEIKDWSIDHLSRHSAHHLSSYTPLNELKAAGNVEKSDFDLLVKVLKVFERDEYNYELRIKDTSSQLWFLTINKLRFQGFVEGDIYRFRSVQREKTTDRNVILCKNTTNILRFPRESRIYRDLSKEI